MKKGTVITAYIQLKLSLRGSWSLNCGIMDSIFKFHKTYLHVQIFKTSFHIISHHINWDRDCSSQFIIDRKNKSET